MLYLRRAHASVPRLIVIILLMLVPASARAIEVPPSTAQTFIQTNGPTADIGLGDWYTSNANGIGVGYHYFGVNIPCAWPNTKPVMIDIKSPEMNASAPTTDEVDKASTTASPTAFELYPPGTQIGTQPGIPAPGTSFPGSLTVYQPVGYPPQQPTPEQWVRFYTLPAPVPCGTYLLRSEASKGDQNAWRLRIGFDDNNDPNDVSPATYDNPDGVAGTGDELTIGVMQTSYQNDVQISFDGCLTLYQYVNPGLTETFFHNFDLDTSRDATAHVRYYGPSDVYDPSGMTGGVVGTVSDQTVWDEQSRGSNVQRGIGDTITHPDGGWWRIVTCVNADNQYIQEGQTGVQSFFTQPPTPVLTVSKDDGLTTTLPNAQQTYTITFTNTSDLTSTPGAASNVTLTDALPSNTTFVGCSIDAPFTGTCTQNGSSALYQIDGLVVAGARGSVKLTVKVNPDATSSVVNSVTITGKDMLGNNIPPTSDNDVDTLPSADLSLGKTVGKQAARLGDSIVFTITISNAGPDIATNVAVSDQWPSGLQFVSVQASQGMYDNTTGVWTVGTLANGATATLKITATVLPSGALINTAQISASDQPDPDSQPNNNDPTEDDQASAEPTTPTAILLRHFSATRQSNGVQVRWTTSVEFDTWGFEVLRSSDGNRAHAIRLTNTTIAARGHNQGGSAYAWTDTTAVSGHNYAYWLQELALDNTVSEYGPATTSVETFIFNQRVVLPMIIK